MSAMWIILWMMYFGFFGDGAKEFAENAFMGAAVVTIVLVVIGLFIWLLASLGAITVVTN